jgi:phage-related protein
VADEELGEGSVRITLDDTAAVGEADSLGDRLERILDRASRDAGARIVRNITRAIRSVDPASVRITADTRDFERAVNNLNNLGSAPIRVTPDVDRARFEAAIQAALAGLEVQVRVTPDLSTFDAAIRAHNTPTVNVNVDVDRSALSRLSGILGGIGRGLGAVGGAAGSALRLGAVGIAAASAAQSFLALGAALAPAAGALAALPAVIAGAVAANAALKLALSGVSDAFGAALGDDAAKFEETLKKLSPAAQAAAREVRALKPAFDDLKSTVQDAFFEPLEGQISGVAKALGGPLKTGLSNIAGNFGLAAQRVAEFLQTSTGIKAVTNVLKGTDQATQGLAAGIGPVAAGFLRVAGSVSAAFGPRLQAALANTGARFGNFLGEAAASGQAVAWVDAAVTVFKQLGEIASNVGGIISGVFGAANDVGGGLLNNLAMITGQFEAFVKSAQGQEAIGNIFATLSTVAAQLGPILSALVTQLGGIAPALAPLFTAIGPAITGLISAIGPALQAIIPGVQALVSGLADGIGQISDSGAFEALGTAIGTIATAIAPLLPVVGQLVGALVSSLAPAVTAIATALTPVISAIADALTPIIPPLTGAITTLVTALTPLVMVIGTTLAQVIQAVAPLLASLAGIVAQVATALAPLIAQVTDALLPIFAQLAPVISTVVAALIPLVEGIINALLPVLPPIIDAFTAILGALLPLLPVMAQLDAAILSVATALLPIIAPIIQFAAEIVKWLAISVVVPVIQRIVSVITGIVGAVTTVISGVAGFVSSMVGFFSNLGTTVPALVNRLVSAVVGFFQGLPGRALSAVSSIVGSLSGVFNSAKAAVVSRVTSLVSEAVALVRGLPGKAKAALGGLASSLVSAGADLIRGFINGIKSMAGSLVSAAKGVVKGAVDGAKSLLGISSPSKVFAEIGKFTAQGFIKGMTGERQGIKQAADQLVKQIQDAFKGKNSKLDDILIKQVRAGQKQLEKLADQRDKLAAKIKQANELAASVTSSTLSSFSLQNLAKNGGGVNGITDGIEQALVKIRKFNAQINDLAKRGLRKDLLGQIIGLGPDQGAGLANTLASASDKQLADLNEAQKQLDAASKKLGKDSADNLFDAGKQASKGFLAGLKAQQKDVEDLMLTLAKAMAKSIRKALGIKSPSRVFAQIGRYTMDGLGAGIQDRVRHVQRSVVGAASALTEPFGAGATVPSFGAQNARQTGTQGRAARTREGAPVTINLNGVGYTDADAQRIVNRIVALTGL